MSAGARVRWDQLGRLAMLCMLVALLYLYASAGVSLLSSRHALAQNRAQVEALEGEHRRLELQHRELETSPQVLREARRLGMERPGEQVYHVGGLPRD